MFYKVLEISHFQANRVKCIVFAKRLWRFSTIHIMAFWHNELLLLAPRNKG